MQNVYTCAEGVEGVQRQKHSRNYQTDESRGPGEASVGCVKRESRARLGRERCPVMRWLVCRGRLRDVSGDLRWDSLRAGLCSDEMRADRHFSGGKGRSL